MYHNIKCHQQSIAESLQTSILSRNYILFKNNSKGMKNTHFYEQQKFIKCFYSKILSSVYYNTKA